MAAARCLMIIAIPLFLCIFSVQSMALEPDLFDARSLGMGGTFACIKLDAASAHFNPALIPSGNAITYTPTIFKLVNGNDFLGKFDDIMDVFSDTNLYDEQYYDPTLDDYANLLRKLQKINERGTNLSVKYRKNLAVSYNNFALSIGLGAVLDDYFIIDMERINPSDYLVDPNSIYYNQSKMFLAVRAGLDLGVSYGRSILTKEMRDYIEGDIKFGGTLRFITGSMTHYTYNIQDNAEQDSEVEEDSVTRGESLTTSSYALDLGCYYEYRELLSVGIVARNINGPEFKYKIKVDEGTFITKKTELKPQARIGAAVMPAKTWTIALDYDITKEKTINTYQRYHFFGLGAQKTFSEGFYALRCGYLANLATSDTPSYITMGFSAGTMSFALATNFDEELMFSFSISSRDLKNI